MEFVIVILVLLAIAGLVYVNRSKTPVGTVPGEGDGITNPVDNNVHEK